MKQILLNLLILFIYITLGVPLILFSSVMLVLFSIFVLIVKLFEKESY